MINMIVAIDKNNLIGSQGSMPWKLSSDMKYFKEITLHKTVIMGRKTFDSIGKALPYRSNIVITNNMIGAENIISMTMNQAKEYAKVSDCFIIGGATIYKEFMPLADRLYITHIDSAFEGDTWFEWNPDEWVLESKQTAPSADTILHVFCVYKRK
jgi:dihydrofolate reductase